MKIPSVLLLMIVAASAAPSSYTDVYDNIDLDEILNNDRLYHKYLECLTGVGKCTPDGKELKERMPDALATGCSKCTEKQKAGSEKVIKFMIEKKPEDYKTLQKIFDPEGIYKKKFQEEAEKRGIKLLD